MSIRVYYQPEHRDSPAIAATADDAEAIIDDLLKQPYEYSLANCYPDRPENETTVELSIGVDPERGVGSLQYLGPSGRWFSKGSGSTYPEVVYCFLGNDREFPHDSEISISAVRRAVSEFVSSGGRRPRNVTWKAASHGTQTD